MGRYMAGLKIAPDDAALKNGLEDVRKLLEGARQEPG
jgi:hypothetical protein